MVTRRIISLQWLKQNKVADKENTECSSTLSWQSAYSHYLGYYLMPNLVKLFFAPNQAKYDSPTLIEIKEGDGGNA